MGNAVSLNSDLSGLAHAAIADGGKGVNSLVGKALASYAKMGVVLHQTACAALFHASETGDTRPLSAFATGLRKNDSDALKLWVNKLVMFEIDNEDGSTIEQRFIGFAKDKGFTVKKGTEEVRKGFFDLDKLLAQPSFQDIDQKAEAKPLGLAEILAMIAKFEKQVDKKASENDVKLPAEVVNAVKALTATVGKVTVQ